LKLDTYIFREWLKIFSLAVAAILGLLLLSEVYNELPGFLKRKAPVETVLSFFLYLIPGYLPSLLPVCFLVSLLFTLAILQRNGEIVAIRAAGVSLFRLSRAFWIGGAILALFLFWLNAALAPQAVEKAALIKERVKETDLDRRMEVVRGTMEDLAVYLPASEELWFVEVFRRSTGQAFGISRTVERGETRIRQQAARGHFDGERQRWILQKGVFVETPPGQTLPETLRTFAKLEVDDTELTPHILLGLSQRPKDLTFTQLGALVKGLEGDPRRTRYLGILAEPLQFFVVVLIALPCALGTGRSRASGGFFRAVWIYLAFFAMKVTFALAGQREIFTPEVAVWAPFFVAAVGGMWMYRKNA